MPRKSPHFRSTQSRTVFERPRHASSLRSITIDTRYGFEVARYARRQDDTALITYCDDAVRFIAASFHALAAAAHAISASHSHVSVAALLLFLCAVFIFCDSRTPFGWQAPFHAAQKKVLRP